MTDKILRLKVLEITSGLEEVRIAALKQIFGDELEIVEVAVEDDIVQQQIFELIDKHNPTVLCFERILPVAFDLLQVLFWIPGLNVLVIGAIHQESNFCGYMRLDGASDARFPHFGVADLLEDQKGR